MPWALIWSCQHCQTAQYPKKCCKTDQRSCFWHCWSVNVEFQHQISENCEANWAAKALGRPGCEFGHFWTCSSTAAPRCSSMPTILCCWSSVFQSVKNICKKKIPIFDLYEILTEKKKTNWGGKDAGISWFNSKTNSMLDMLIKADWFFKFWFNFAGNCPSFMSQI